MGTERVLGLLESGSRSGLGLGFGLGLTSRMVHTGARKGDDAVALLEHVVLGRVLDERPILLLQQAVPGAQRFCQG